MGHVGAPSPWTQQPWQQPIPRSKVNAGALVGLSTWRLVIVVCAFTGFGAAVVDFGFASAIPGLSQLASLVVGVVYLGLLAYPLFVGGRRHEPGSPWLRGAMTVLLLLVAGTFLTLMAGDVDETSSLFDHVLTPIAVLVDWVAIGRNQARAKWWHPPTWIVFPLAYLIYFLAADLDLYRGFLDPDDSAFAGTVAGFLGAVIAAGYLLYGIGKLKAAIAGGQATGMPPQPMPQPWQYPQQPPPQQYPPAHQPGPPAGPPPRWPAQHGQPPPYPQQYPGPGPR